MSTTARLYCFGGRDETRARISSASELDLNTGKWTVLPPMSTIKAHFGGAVIGNKIFICGGNTGNGILDTMEVFDCETHSWSLVSAMPEPRRECAAAVLNGFIYVSGGRDNEGRPMSSNIRYDVRTDQWSSVSPMQNARSEHQLIELNDRLYAIRGFGEKTVEEYCPTTDQWTVAANTNCHHFNFGATVHNDKIYVCSDAGFEVYSPDTQSWALLGPPPVQLGGRTLVSVSQSKLWAIGGGSPNEGGSKSRFEFDLASGQWSQLPDMDIARRHHCSFVVHL